MNNNTLVINNRKFNITKKNEKYLIYQYCSTKGINLPCFCYNENLAIAGNCRICLVEIKNMPKLMLSCSTKIMKNMVINTDTTRVKRVRKSIVEFLLINHPLDCPVCDQGGECDLQKISKKSGLNRGRFYELKKRSVLDKEGGFFIKTVMTRCIHCTRCVRFYKEIESINGFGLLGRGEETEIVLNKRNLLSILSGNVVDICPVGALTSKIFSFKGRIWDFEKHENIDILDSMCSSISLHLRGTDLMRILPVSDSFINSDWITNLTRYFFDYLMVQRLDNPRLLLKQHNLTLGWPNIAKIIINNLIKSLLNNYNINFFISDFLDLESLYFLKHFNNNLGFLNVVFEKNIFNIFDLNFFYFFNTSLSNLKFYTFFFFVALNLRLQMPLLNVQLKQQLKLNNINIFSLGFASFDFSVSIINLGNNLQKFLGILENKSLFVLNLYFNSFFLSTFFSLINFKKKALLVGDNFFFINKINKLLINFCFVFSYSYKDLFVLFRKTIDLNQQHLGLKTYNKSVFNSKFLYSFTPSVKKTYFTQGFSVLQNSHFYKNTRNFNLILPVTSFFEFEGSFLNFAGYIRTKLKVYSYKNHLMSNSWILKYLVLSLDTALSFHRHLFFFYFVNLFTLNYAYFYEFCKYNLFLSSKLLFFHSFFFLSKLTFDDITLFDYQLNNYKLRDISNISKSIKKAHRLYKLFLNVLLP